MPDAKRNTLDDSFTLNIDLPPTILGAAGIAPPAGMQGRDIAALYLPRRNGATTWREEFFYEYKLSNGRSMPTNSALVRKDFKYIYWPQFKYEQLFNLEADPLEDDDIVNKTEYQVILFEMRQRHNELELEVR